MIDWKPARASSNSFSLQYLFLLLFFLASNVEYIYDFDFFKD